MVHWAMIISFREITGAHFWYACCEQIEEINVFIMGLEPCSKETENKDVKQVLKTVSDHRKATVQ